MWDGRRWVPVPQVAATRGSSNRGLLMAVGLVALVLLLGVCGLGVCAVFLNSSNGGGSGSGPAGNIVGTYQLKQIDGHNLPAGGSFNQFVYDGSLALKSDGTYSIRFGWQGELGNSRFTGDDGPYTRSGTTITFQPRDETYRYSGQLGDRSVLVTYDWSRNGKVDRFLFSR